MRKDKARAIELRKRGNSYSQIQKTLNISKSTLSYWLRNIKVSKNAQAKISERVRQTSVAGLIKRNIRQTALAAERANQIRYHSKKEVRELIKNPLFLAGISLYWAEGYTKGAEGSRWKGVDFANSDPGLIKIMMKFFRKVCKVKDKRIRIQLMAHPNVNTKKAIHFWSNLTDIPANQFTKTCYKISKRSKRKRNPKSLIYGTIHIRIYDVKLFFRIIGWIDGIKSIMTK